LKLTGKHVSQKVGFFLYCIYNLIGLIIFRSKVMDLKWDREFAFEQSGEDDELLEELLELFRTSSNDDLQKIKEAVAIKDPEAAGEAAHSVKGAAASLGVEAVREVAYEMEQAGKEGNLEIIIKSLPIFEAMLGQLDTLS
jgi:histidine phosphotransfer protein HptB